MSGENSIKNKQIAVDKTLFRLSRLERTLDFIMVHNPNLKLPTEEEMSTINLVSLEDAHNGEAARRMFEGK